MGLGEIFSVSTEIRFCQVSLYLQNMSIKGCLERLDQRTCIFVVFCVQLVSKHHLLCMSKFPNYLCNGTDVYTSAWVWNLNPSFNSIQQSCWWPMLIFIFLAESVKILVQLCAGFPAADIFPQEQTFRISSK